MVRNGTENNIEKKFSIAGEFVREYISRKIKKEQLLVFFSFIIFLSILVFGGQYGSLSPAISRDQVVKEMAVKQGRVIAGQPVTWTKVVALSDIDEQSKYLLLPKDASNINVKSGALAESAFQEKEQEPSLQQKAQFAKALKEKTTQEQSLFASVLDSITSGISSAINSLSKTSGQEVIESINEKFLNLHNTSDILRGNLVVIQYVVKKLN